MKLYIYSNRHIKDQVINIEKNGCIVLENDLSKFIWKKYFQYNKLDEIESTINYVQLEKILEKEFRMKFNAIVGNPPYEDSQSTGQNNKISSNERGREKEVFYYLRRSFHILLS